MSRKHDKMVHGFVMVFILWQGLYSALLFNETVPVDTTWESNKGCSIYGWDIPRTEDVLMSIDNFKVMDHRTSISRTKQDGRNPNNLKIEKKTQGSMRKSLSVDKPQDSYRQGTRRPSKYIWDIKSRKNYESRILLHKRKQHNGYIPSSQNNSGSV